MGRSLAANALLIIIVALVALGLAINWGKDAFYAAGPLGADVEFIIESGESIVSVGDRLEADGIISSAMVFRLGARYTDRRNTHKHGAHIISAGASMDDVLNEIAKPAQSFTEFRVTVTLNEAMTFRAEQRADGAYAQITDEAQAAGVLAGDESSVSYRLTLPEGVTSFEAVERMAQVSFLGGRRPELPPEGSLAPDTYEVANGADREALVAEMMAAQAAILASAWERRNPDLPIESPEDLLILASIVEKETGVADERRQVASVFVNRLRQGMRLQTDPTVIYGVTLGREKLGRGLRRSELDAETPYNTYVIFGLPPTPIANPGRAAIEAAANPDDTPYIFFVADGTGGHAFATTLAEHNANVARWRAIEAGN
ncbi:MAG: endolytic transglycosylase MltG [Paracoccaceae bacterium]